MLTLAFVGRELVIDKPFLNLRLLAKEGIVPILLILAGFRFIILSTAYIIPTYLQVVQDYRELQVGAVLLWIALPQFLIVLPLGWLLSRIDARWILAVGAIFIGVACLMGTFLTQDWATDDFLPSQILQAIGQSFALTAVVVLAVKSMNPADVLTIGTLFQTVRLFGGEIGTAFMQTFVRVREQIHSNLIGLHVDSLGGMTADRLAAYRNVVGAHTSDVAAAAARATSLLGAAVAKQAAVLSYIDGFLAAAVGAFVCLLFTALLAAALTAAGRASTDARPISRHQPWSILDRARRCFSALDYDLCRATSNTGSGFGAVRRRPQVLVLEPGADRARGRPAKRRLVRSELA